ncbi:MFS transporter [Allokutzneria sp. A3M-2-11 16]|uniref:MFS transporter n=1 Tax=Allokutzneria sp. A3M-2-11 16 TaxID=2962043 RepID=UPI0020B7F66E|nr:MFS transporter [Allokutzneria sp. A3M-2-11 16]MCP3805060.1 MFS transporter [Allokutzneria sp. A3M-2-11 16]
MVSPSRVTFGHVLTRPVFRELFLARVVTIASDVLRTVALSTAVFHGTGSAWLAALTFGLAFLPQAFTGVLLGPLADRVRPRVLIAGEYLVTGIATALLGWVPMPPWVSLGVITVLGCLAPAFSGAAGRLLAETLDGEAYVLARSLMSMAVSFAQIVGLALGGIAVAVLGPATALSISAACALASAAAIWLLLPDSAPPKATESLVRQGIRGTRQLLADRRVRALLIVQWLPPAFVAGAEGLLVPFALSSGLSTGAAGMMIASLPVGMLVGELAVVKLLSARARERSTPALIALMGLPLLGFALAPSVVPACALLVASGAGFGYVLGVAAPFREAVPEPLLGQAFTLLSAGLMTAQGLGPVLWGALAEHVSVGNAIAVAGAVTLSIAWAYRESPEPRRPAGARRCPSARHRRGGGPRSGAAS